MKKTEILLSRFIAGMMLVFHRHCVVENCFSHISK